MIHSKHLRRAAPGLCVAAAAIAFSCFHVSDESVVISAPEVAEIADRVTLTNSVVLPASARSDRPGLRGDGHYSAAVGTELTFAVTAKIGAELVRQKEMVGEDAGTTGMRGPMQVTILARREGEFVAAIRFPGAQLTSSLDRKAVAPRMQRLCDALERPVLVRMDSTGRCLGYQFPTEVGFLARNHIRTVLASLRFIVPDDPKRSWVGRDDDEMGTFEARYSRADDSSIVRQKTRYLEMRIAGASGAEEPKPLGRATATLSEQIGWIDAAKVRENLVLPLPRFGAELRTTVHVDLVFRNASVVALVGQPSVDWAGRWAPVAADPAKAELAAEAREAEKWRRELTRIPVSDLVDWFVGLHANEAAQGETYTQAWDHIVWKCRLEPNAIEAIVAMVRSGRVQGAAAGALLTAMGDAATPAVQAALVQLHGDSSLGIRMRADATVALLQSPKPTPQAVQGLFETVRGAAGKTDLGKMSLLVLGTLAGRSDRSLADGRAPMDALLAMESDARQRGGLDAWLLALGNSGSPRVVPHAARHLENPDPKIRESAATALRQSKTERACDLLVLRATRDREPEVRRRAIESLTEHGTLRAKAALRRLVQSERSAAVREAIVVGLATDPRPADLDLLRSLGRSDKNERVRQLVAQILRST